MDSHLPITVGLKEAMQDHTCTIIVHGAPMQLEHPEGQHWRP